MLDCCLRRNGWYLLLLTKIIHGLWPKGRIKHVRLFHPHVPVALGTVGSRHRDFLPPWPPGSPVLAHKPQTSSFSTCVALLCSAVSKSPWQASCGLYPSSFSSLPHILQQRLFTWHSGQEAEWCCRILGHVIGSHTTLLTHIRLTLGSNAILPWFSCQPTNTYPVLM